MHRAPVAVRMDGTCGLSGRSDAYARDGSSGDRSPTTCAELVTDALQMELARRRPETGLIWHSDQAAGSPASRSVSRQVLQVSLKSMGSKGDRFDKRGGREVLRAAEGGAHHGRSWPTKAELRPEPSSSSRCSSTAAGGTRRSGCCRPRGPRITQIERLRGRGSGDRHGLETRVDRGGGSPLIQDAILRPLAVLCAEARLSPAISRAERSALDACVGADQRLVTVRCIESDVDTPPPPRIGSLRRAFCNRTFRVTPWEHVAMN